MRLANSLAEKAALIHAAQANAAQNCPFWVIAHPEESQGQDVQGRVLIRAVISGGSWAVIELADDSNSINFVAASKVLEVDAVNTILSAMLEPAKGEEFDGATLQVLDLFLRCDFPVLLIGKSSIDSQTFGHRCYLSTIDKANLKNAQ